MDKVVHFEIPADDVRRAQKFYQSLFGWKIDAVPDMPYWMVKTVETDQKNMPKEAGAINGGLFERQSGEGPVIVINVPNLEAYLKKVEKAGGKIAMPKQQVGDMGLYAKVEDTEGNVIGLWQNLKR